MAQGFRIRKDVLATSQIKLQRKMRKLALRAPNALDNYLNAVAADILQRSVDLCPILTGELIASARVTGGGSSKFRRRKIVSFGTGHAVFIHEGFYNLGPVSRRKDAQARSADGPVGRKFMKRPWDLHKGRYKYFLLRSSKEALLALGSGKNPVVTEV